MDPVLFGADLQDHVDAILASHINNVRAWLTHKKTLNVNLPTEAYNGGWIEIPDGTWTYASATTITVPSGAASIYQVGDEIRLKQGGGYKYFSVVAVADTLLTVTGGSDYTVANAAITDAAFSKGGGVGHPGWFEYSPIITYGGGSGTPSATITFAKILIVRNLLKIQAFVNIARNGATHTYTDISFPSGITGSLDQSNANCYQTVVGSSYARSIITTVSIRCYHGAMTGDGEIKANADVEI